MTPLSSAVTLVFGLTVVIGLPVLAARGAKYRGFYAGLMVACLGLAFVAFSIAPSDADRVAIEADPAMRRGAELLDATMATVGLTSVFASFGCLLSVFFYRAK